MIPMKVIYHIAPLFIFFFPVSLFAAPFQAEGFKTGEMTDHSAIVWTRLTRNEKANPADRPLFEILYTKKGKGRRFPVTGVKYASKGGAADLPFAVPGMEGETRVRFRPLAGGEWRETPWTPVAKEWDFTCQHILNDLSPGTRYEIEVESRGTDGKEAGAVQKGGFVTSPSPEVSASVSFTVSTGQMFSDRNSDDGYAIYDSMLKDPPDFFVHTGDIVYYDREAKSPDLANWLWQRMYSRPSNVRFHKRVGSYFMKDDHDTFRDDCWPSIKTQSMGSMTFAKGQDIFVHQVPMHGRKTYRTRRWGKDLQIWMVEGRDFRSPNTMIDGPDKTIWGQEQKKWFQKTFSESDAAFRVLISPTPIVGPDRDNKHDNLANSNFTHEGNEIRSFLGSQKNAFVVCGDRHWQYHSRDPGTGLNEFSCGPASDKHAGGWKQSDYRKKYHQFLRVQGGYLEVRVNRDKGSDKPFIRFVFHGEDGQVAYEKRFE